jgi:hypothetical protein
MVHGTREAQIDDLLRRRKLVDLYKVVREGARISEPGYSLKNVEVFFGADRTGEVRTAWATRSGGSARICRGGAPGPLPCGRAHLFAVDGDTLGSPQ